MVDEDTAGSGDRSEEEKELDLKVPEDKDYTEMAVSSLASQTPSGDPPEGVRGARKWQWNVVFLCFFGFMTSIKPGEPFITPYLLSPEKNFTREQVSERLCEFAVSERQPVRLFFKCPSVRLSAGELTTSLWEFTDPWLKFTFL